MFIFRLILEIETIIEDSLYAILWEGEVDNSFEQMVNYYNDAEDLYSYFLNNSEKLEHYKNPSYTPEDAAIGTQKEANAIIQELKLLALDKSESALGDLFEPLHTNRAKTHSRYITDVKVKGDLDIAPWLRVYAVKCDENLYVITGYGIKLTKDMRDEPSLRVELNKLSLATIFLDSIQMIYR